MKKRFFYCRQILSALLSTLLITSNIALAQPIVVATGSGATNVYLAPNGVPVVNIDTANNKGLSHNKFIQYNVEKNGLILNNGNPTLIDRKSQLAGQILANQNLNQEAKFILNEVTSPNRTRLEGFTEVLGGKADVIIANPFGITAEGCGFMNTDRVTLTTGSPNIETDGTLKSFNVSTGDLLIQGEGINANSQQLLDIVTRSAKIDGQINVPTLNILTGTNQWEYAAGTNQADYAADGVTGDATPDGDAPTYAIDSTVLGGLYADRIRIIATEDGAGVRMLGDAAANADDFTLTSDGKIEIKSKISAERDIDITGAETRADSLTLTGASLSAKHNIDLTAVEGGAEITGGKIIASVNLTEKFGALNDTSSINADDTDNNRRFAGGLLDITVTNDAEINGVSYGAAQDFTGEFGSFTVGANSAELYSKANLGFTAGTGNMILNNATITSVQDISLTSTVGSITFVGGDGHGIKIETGNLAIIAGNGFENAGAITADAGSLTARVSGQFSNTGEIHSKTAMDMEKKDAEADLNINNAGVIISDDTLSINANNIVNADAGSIQGTKGSTVTAASLDNSGLFNASDTDGISGAFTLGFLTNQVKGIIQSAEDLTFDVASAFTNSGKIIASNDLTTAAGTSSVLSLINKESGIIQAGNLLTVKGKEAADNTIIDNQAGTLLGVNRLNLKIYALTNSDIIQGGASGALLDITNSLANSGKIITDGALTINANAITNTDAGSIQGTKGSTVTATSLDNAGLFNASDTDGISGAFTLSTLTNQGTGTIQSKEDLTFDIANTLTNSGKMLASNNLITSAQTSSILSVINKDSGIIQAGALLNIKGKDSGDNAIIDNQAGTLLGVNKLNLKLSSLTNSDIIQSGTGGALLNITNGFTSSGKLITDGALTINADTISNTGGIQGTKGSTVTATSLDNAGLFNASDTDGISGAFTLATLTNQGAGIIQSKEDLTFDITTTLTNSGKMIAADSLTASARTSSTLSVINKNNGIIQAGGLLNVKGMGSGVNTTIDNQAGTLLGVNKLTLQLSGLTNADIIQGGTGGASLAVTNSITNSGKLITDGYLGILAGSISNTSAGSIQGTNGSEVAATSFDNAGLFNASDTAGKSGVFNLDSLTNQAAGTIQSKEDLTFNIANTLTNSGKIIATNNLTTSAKTTSALSVINKNNGIIQAGALLNIKGKGTGANTTIDNQAGTLLGVNNLNLKLSSLTNGDIIQAGTGGALLDITNGVTNSGKLIADGALTLNSDTISNTGSIQGTNGATVTATSLDNAGLFNASDTAEKSGVFNLDSLTNQAAGSIQSKLNLTFKIANSFTNSGKLIGANNLSINSSSVVNNAAGIIQADSGLLKLQGITMGSGTSLASQDGTLKGDAIHLIINGDMTNNGVIQGGTATDSLIDISSATLTNADSGMLLLATSDTGGGEVKAASLSNSGTIQSKGELDITTDTFDNSGKTLSEGATTFRGITGGAYTLTTDGRIQTGGLLDIGDGDSLNVNIGAAGVILGDSMKMNAASLTVADDGMLSSIGNMDLQLGSLIFNGVTSRIVAATNGSGDATVALSNSFSNVGAVHSSGNMDFSAPEIENTVTGGFSALNTLKLSASTGDLTNKGSLYSGGLLDLTSAGKISNIDDTGEINSDGSVNIKADTEFLNQNTINASEDITVSAPIFTNETLGAEDGMTRAWEVTDKGDPYLLDTKIWHYIGGVAQNELPGHDLILGFDYRDYWTKPPNIGVFDIGAADLHRLKYYKSVKIEKEKIEGDLPPVSQLIAGKTLTIKDFNKGTNEAATISGDTVILTGNSGSEFTNKVIEVEEKTTTTTYQLYTMWALIGPETYFVDKKINEITEEKTETVPSSSSSTAGIFANTLTATGFDLVNSGDPRDASTTSTSVDGASSETLADGVAGATGSSGATGTTAVSGVAGAAGTSATGGANSISGVAAANAAAGISGTTAANGAPAISFGGLIIKLPTNPNGYYVMSKDPNSDYLVEVNPLFSVGSDFIGSHYMEKRYGYSPDKTIKRLGDANYEAYLIRQQIIKQTGNNKIAGYGDEAAQMKRLMEQGLAEANAQGLKYGAAPTKKQLANLKKDIVWMVETFVAGQRVLTPVVYLAQSTKDSVETGAVIAANDMNMNLASLSNTGGTISGSDSLNIVSKKDITNISGTIKGGAVSVKSTEGSILNKTYSKTSGDDVKRRTTIGKTANITSTGSLAVDAAKNITNLGAQMKAGGSASIKAGGEIKFDTIEKKTATTTDKTELGFFSLKRTKSNEQTTEQIKSGLTVGGDLKMKSGKDITLAGTDTDVSGNAIIDAGGDFNILARNNIKKVKSNSFSAGLFSPIETEKKDIYQSKNLASTFKVGGSSLMKAQNKINIVGSELDISGNLYQKAKDIEILEGRDIDKTKTEKTSIEFFKIGKGSASAGASAKASAGASARGSASGSALGGSASASAEAGAKAGYKASGGFNLFTSSKTESETYNSKSVGSKIKVGGYYSAEAENDILFRGADVDVKGDMELDAKNVKAMAAKDTSTSKTKTDTVSIGFNAESEGSVEAKAKAYAKADGSLGGGAGRLMSGSAKVGAHAKAGAKIENNIDLLRIEKKETDTKDITNIGSILKAGGKLKIKAKEKLSTQGSELSGEKGVSLRAKDMEFLAAEDVHTSSEKTEKTGIGIYVDGKATAKAGARAGIGGAGGVSAEAGAEAVAKASGGVQMSHKKTNIKKGSTKAKVSAIKSGSGSIERIAENSIKDIGTDIEAAGDFTQSAKTIKSLAAKNTKYKIGKSEDHSAKVGAYAKAEASASAGTSGGANAGAGATVGGEASYGMSKSSTEESSSNAVVSKIKAGGKVKSVSTEKTTFEGTKIDGGDVEIEAGELDYKAAKNTKRKKSDTTKAGGSVSAGVGVGSNAVEGSVGMKYEGGKEEEESSTAVAGGITSAGGLKIKTTKGDARLVGTKIDSAGDAEIDAAGDFKFDAATSTSSKKKSSQNLKVDVAFDGSVEGGAKGGYSKSSEQSVKQEGGSINAGGKLKVKSGKDMTLVGSDITAGKDAELEAAGNFDYKAAKDTTKSSSEKLNAGFSHKTYKGGDSEEDSKGASLGYGTDGKKSEKVKTGSIKSGGNLNVKSGKNVTVENADKKVLNNAKVEAGGTVESKTVKSSPKSDKPSEKSVKAEASVAVKTNTQSAQAAALIKTPAFTQGAISGKAVDMKGWNAEVKTEFAKKIIAEAIGVDSSKVDITKNPKFAELNQKLQEAESINGSGPNSFDLTGFCKTLKTD